MTRRLANFFADTTRKRRILALDGGGVRGFLTIEILRQLESDLRRRSGDPNYTLSQYFDLIGGTSTGSIIATGLALGWNVADVWAAYELIVPRIFGKAAGVGILSPRYKNKPLEQAFIENFGDKALEAPELETGLAIFAKRMDSGSAWMMVNNPGWCYYDSRKPNDTFAPNHTFKLRSIVQASAAAPHYFRGVKMKIEHNAGKKKALDAHFVDGGVGGLNNPALELLTMVRDPAFGFNWPIGAENLYLLSVGTGWIRSIDRAKGIIPRFVEGLFIKQTVNALRGMINDVSLQQVAYMQGLARTDMPWYINSEKEHQGRRAYLAVPASGEPDAPLRPLLHYQRVDVRLEDETDRDGNVLPESPSALIGDKLSHAQVNGLNEITNSAPANLELLKALGRAAGERFIREAPPPESFNPDPWTRTGDAAPTRLL